MLRSTDDAEEAVQEAFIRAWRSQHHCRDSASPLPWLLRITRNEALRLYGRRRPDVPLDDGDPDTGFDIPSPAEAVVDALAVRTALASLPADDQLLLRLRYERDLTQPRVAELVGLPEGTVKVRLHRLRGRLRRALEEST